MHKAWFLNFMSVSFYKFEYFDRSWKGRHFHIFQEKGGGEEQSEEREMKQESEQPSFTYIALQPPCTYQKHIRMYKLNIFQTHRIFKHFRRTSKMICDSAEIGNWRGYLNAEGETCRNFLHFFFNRISVRFFIPPAMGAFCGKHLTTS